MTSRKRTRCLTILAALSASAAADAQGERARPDARPKRGAAVGGPDGRALPHADGREFRTLDEYLAHLRDFAAPMDRPWYREVEPGLFRLERGNFRGEAGERLFTREELERRFGFRR